MNIVFDFGGVLFRWVPQEVVAKVLPHRAPDATAAQVLVDDIFENYGGDWREFDRGTVEAGPLAERISARTGLPLADVQAVIRAIPHELVPVAGTVDLLRRLHAAGRSLYFLSNMPAPFAHHLEASHAFMSLFREGVFSGRVQLVKPDPEIFAHAVALFGIDPADTVFIDDFEHNVEAARACGWKAIHFRDAEQCGRELAALGLL